ncbi:protein kinase [Nocardioides sp. cx-173]|uniref:protein kinase domain-containing protein n=1 Tax=Nocardioides sp. cx-173 TaxID=2898796 RepID=UPI001E564449|nr:protein kinase [Nocardioides sp. cx-173]MCD4524170.1 protein kinase [Nocardioides sp. cx-173]UGB41565.1 protein kinase [Nocardioides sp. cx-173]
MPQFPRVGDLFGRYRIDAQIGQGGMGVVFAATDTAFDRRVALKVVSAALGGSAEFLARFEREASLLARLNSPHVIAIFDYGEQDGCPYLATQYVGGGDLGALLAARGPMPPRLAAQVCAQVADALSDAHHAGVVHRDVKPTNVLLRDADTAELHAYLCDFGIARTDSEGLTAPGSVSGTWSYLAPECGAGAPGTVSSDLYALGCLYWATLTGQPPFRGSDVEIAIAHQNAPIPQLAGDDPFVRHANAILANTLAKDPRARYDTADALRTDLLSAASIPTSGVRPLPAGPTVPPGGAAPTAFPSGGRVSLGSLPRAAATTAGAPRRRRTALTVLLSSLAVLAVAGGVVAVTMPGDGDQDPTGGSTSSSEPTASEPAPSEPPAPEVVGPVTGDMDGDGYADLVASFYVEETKKKPSHDRVGTWHSDGSTLVPAGDKQEPRLKDRTALEQVLGDFDGDDELELVQVRFPTRGALTVTAELSGGTSVNQPMSRPDQARALTAHAGDADGDGADDLLLVNWGQDMKRMEVWVATSDGSSFGEPALGGTVPFGYEQGSLETGDFDGDGIVDVGVLMTPSYSATRSTLHTYLGRPDGTFVERGRPLTFESAIGHYFLSADVDGDEDAELVVGLNRTEFVELLVADHGPGGPQRPRPWGLIQLPSADFFSSDLTVGDYDGDGRDDVASIGPTKTKGRASLQVALSKGKRFATTTEWGTWAIELGESYSVELLGSTFP